MQHEAGQIAALGGMCVACSGLTPQGSTGVHTPLYVYWCTAVVV